MLYSDLYNLIVLADSFAERGLYTEADAIVAIVAPYMQDADMRYSIRGLLDDAGLLQNSCFMAFEP